MTKNADTIGVGIIGYGFMGQTHARSYQRAHRDGHGCRIVAIAEPAVDSLDQIEQRGNLGVTDPIDHSGIAHRTDPELIFTDPSISLVSICTHTESHVDLAIRALRSGKHVLVEKPVAIEPEEVAKLAGIARDSDKVCMPAMCMRYWPAWVKIREIIQNGEHGRVRSAAFNRLGSRPDWNPEFYRDESRSGGVLFDLHIHDADFIVHCLGMPDAVTTTGDGLHLTTLYHFENGPAHVTAHAAWDHPPAAGFDMRCTIVFERASLDFDINRTPQLVLNDGHTQRPVEVPDHSGYDGEIRAILHAIRTPEPGSSSMMTESVLVTRLLRAEGLSRALGTKQSLGH